MFVECFLSSNRCLGYLMVSAAPGEGVTAPLVQRRRLGSGNTLVSRQIGSADGSNQHLPLSWFRCQTGHGRSWGRRTPLPLRFLALCPAPSFEMESGPGSTLQPGEGLVVGWSTSHCSLGFPRRVMMFPS